LDLNEATEKLQQHTGITAEATDVTAIGGGNISQAYRVPSDEGPLFLKLGRSDSYEQFAAEVDGLEALEECGALRTPEILCHGKAGTIAYLFLEWLDLGRSSAAAETSLGRSLAQQHRATAKSFGWSRNNFIGSTYQSNELDDDWTTFWRDRRLRFQLDLAVRNGLPAAYRQAGAKVLAGLEIFFGDREIAPSLLHGDLWSGNWGSLAADVPCIFDPAVYRGDRETDLAMTRLFGGFGRAFYDAYMAAWPLRSGWEERIDLYNLYHLLNHFNLFGGGYLPQIRGTLTRLVERC
jgi:fructosamine-3-kinase